MLACQCYGAKSLPALVLLHGFLGSSDDWLSLLPELEKKAYLVMIDLPGHGKSPFTSGLNFYGFADTLEQTVTGIGLKRFSLLGYSLGGRLAMSYAHQYPHRLNALLLEGSHSGLQDQKEREARLVSDQYWAGRFIEEPVKVVLDDWYRQPVFADLTESRREALIEARSLQDGSELGEAMMAFSLGRQPDFSPCLKKADFPVHYLYGERDSKFAGLGRHLKEEGCLTSLQCIGASGHNVHREKPVEFAHCVQRLIRQGYGD